MRHLFNIGKSLKWQFVLLVFVLFYSNTFSQITTLDTLSVILKSSIHDTTKCNLLAGIIEREESLPEDYNVQLKKLAQNGFTSEKSKLVKNTFGKYLSIANTNEAYQYASNDDFKNALKYFILAKNTAFQIEDSVVAASALVNIGNCYRMLSDNTNALKIFEQSLIIYQRIKDENGIAEAFYNLGFVYNNIGDIPKSLEFYHQALKIFEKLKDTEGVGKTLNNIAYIYNYQGDTKTALEYYNKSLNLHTKEKDQKRIAVANNNIGKIYQKLAKYSTALDYYTKSLKQFEAIKNKLGIGFTLNNIGDVYSFLNNNEKALDYYERSLEIRNEIGDLEGSSVTYTNIAEIYFVQNKFSEAKVKALEGLKIAKSTGNPEGVKMATNILYKIYEKLNDSKNAHEMYKTYIQMRDSINNISTQKAVINQLAKYKYEKKALADSIKVAKEKQISDLELAKVNESRKKLIAIVVGVVLIALVLIVLIYLLFKNNKERKLAYLKLQEKNIEIQNQSEIMVAQSKQITKYQTQMNPHFVFNALNSIQGFVMNNEKEKTLQQLLAFSKLMRQTLNNSDVDTISLKQEIEYLSLYVNFEKERFTKPFEFIVDANLDTDEIQIPPMLIQPLIENALKHAGLNDVEDATIKLLIAEQGNLLKITVSDNGKGIQKNRDELIENSHALSIIKSRMKLLFENEKLMYKNEYFNFISVPDISQGTQIEFFLPLITKF